MDKIAAVILSARSSMMKGQVGSEPVAGSTTLYGEPVRFKSRIIVDTDRVSVLIVYEQFEGRNNPLPPDVNFEMDSSGTAKVSPLDPTERVAIEELFALKAVPCQFAHAFTLAALSANGGLGAAPALDLTLR